ncbi:hypothetical protein NKH18_03855 [Streptomyces sp. M10(2022)]
MVRERAASATVVVADPDAPAGTVAGNGAVITAPVRSGPTGRCLCARHEGGAEAEYVQWLPELVRRIVHR